MCRLILCLTMFFFLISCTDGVKVKEPSLAPSKYSDSFNRNTQKILDDYYALSESFVNWDSVELASRAANLIKNIDETGFEELRKDKNVHQAVSLFKQKVRGDLARITEPVDITTKRMAFNSVTERFYDLLNTIQYDRSRIYLNECNMPYNDGGSGLWLSRSAETDSLRNPYLGLHHPKYKKGMLHCGITRDSVNFITYQ